jgi:hypothetical protein
MTVTVNINDDFQKEFFEILENLKNRVVESFEIESKNSEVEILKEAITEKELILKGKKTFSEKEFWDLIDDENDQDYQK